MAKIFKTRAEVVKYEDAFVLTLDKDEIKALISVMRGVGGCPDSSSRKYTDRIYNALCSCLNFSHHSDYCKTRGTVYFEDII